MLFKCLVCGKLPRGEELVKIADELGVSQINTWLEKSGKTGLDEPELQRRVLEAKRARRESLLWIIAFSSALASVFSAIAAWYAVLGVTAR